MNEIYLRNIGRHALVDDGDYAWLSGFGWHGYKGRKDRHYYARATLNFGPGETETVQLHRLVCGAGPGEAVTFLNGNRLDCRRSNLVLATREEIRAHSHHASNVTGYRGVHRNYGAFCAQIGVDYATRYLGSYPTPELAALAFDRAARELHGELAKLNFPDVTDYSAVVRSDRRRRSASAVSA